MLLSFLLLPLVHSRHLSPANMTDSDGPVSCCDATQPHYNAMAKISHQFAYELISDHVLAAGPTDVALSPYSIMSVLQVTTKHPSLYIFIVHHSWIHECNEYFYFDN